MAQSKNISFALHKVGILGQSRNIISSERFKLYQNNKPTQTKPLFSFLCCRLSGLSFADHCFVFVLIVTFNFGRCCKQSESLEKHVLTGISCQMSLTMPVKMICHKRGEKQTCLHPLNSSHTLTYNPKKCRAC